MIIKSSDINRLQKLFVSAGNQLAIVYGRIGSGKETMLMNFLRDKQFFYYRCREAAPEYQKKILAEELAKRFQVNFIKDTYDEYFNKIKANGPAKLVVVIDEAHLLIKKDPEFLQSIIRLRNKKLYAGPVQIILSSSSTVWATQEAIEMFGDQAKKIDAFIKAGDLNFLDVVRAFPDLSVSDAIKIYGVLGGVPEYLDYWDPTKNFKNNICRLILSPTGVLHNEAVRVISAELRELSVYSTILSAIAQGNNKLNDLFLVTGFSRAKISVYLKNLSHFDIIEKVVSIETGGWDNAKKGIYQIKDTFVNFYYRFIYPNISDIYLMMPLEFYEIYIEQYLDEYFNRYFQNVCMEYILLLDKMDKLPFKIHKMGTWLGKTGKIDIIVQSSDRRNIVGLCNWDKQFLDMKMCEELFESMEKAKISSQHFFLFSAKSFELALTERAKEDSRFELIDINEL